MVPKSRTVRGDLGEARQMQMNKRQESGNNENPKKIDLGSKATLHKKRKIRASHRRNELPVTGAEISRRL